jgi:predicted transcriptional regulator
MPEISPENLQYLERSVIQGVYPTTAAALDEAVRLLRRRDEVRAQLQAGIDQADRGELLEADEVFERLRRRAADIETQARQQ